MAPNANRAWRCAIPGWETTLYRKNVTIEKFVDSQLLFQFVSPHSSDMLEPRNVVPYYEFPIYRTGNQPHLPARARYGQMPANGEFIDPLGVQISSSNVQLSGIPDKLIVFVRKTINNIGSHDAESYATIMNISINFNNQAGLLSSMTQQQLYRNSVLVGLSWDQFSGSVVSVAGANNVVVAGQPCTLRNAYAGLGANYVGAVNNPGFQLVPTTGTILVLNFAEVIQLTEDYYALGSLGSFNLQVTATMQNNTNVAWGENSYELVVMPLNCGVFVNEKGTSSTFLNLLTKQDVIDASRQQAYSHSEIHRMVGGSFLDNIRSSLGWITSKLPAVKQVLNHVPHAYAQTGARVLDSLGYAKPAGKLQDRLM